MNAFQFPKFSAAKIKIKLRLVKRRNREVPLRGFLIDLTAHRTTTPPTVSESLPINCSSFFSFRPDWVSINSHLFSAGFHLFFLSVRRNSYQHTLRGIHRLLSLSLVLIFLSVFTWSFTCVELNWSCADGFCCISLKFIFLYRFLIVAWTQFCLLIS